MAAWPAVPSRVKMGDAGQQDAAGTPDQRSLLWPSLHSSPGCEVSLEGSTLSGWTAALLWRPEPDCLGQAPTSCVTELSFRQGRGPGGHGHSPANSSVTHGQKGLREKGVKHADVPWGSWAKSPGGEGSPNVGLFLLTCLHRGH